MTELARMTWEVAKSIAIIVGSAFLAYIVLHIVFTEIREVRDIIKTVKEMKKKNRG